MSPTEAASFQFKYDAGAQPSPGLLPTTDTGRTLADTQRGAFLKQTYEKEAELLGLDPADGPLTKTQMCAARGVRRAARASPPPRAQPPPPAACRVPPSPPAHSRSDLLDRIKKINAEAITTRYSGTMRSDELVAKSVDIHKRVNSGYVEMPYRSSSQVDYVYKPPPAFSKAFLKKDSDCAFQKYAAEAILKHVDLKKTSH